MSYVMNMMDYAPLAVLSLLSTLLLRLATAQDRSPNRVGLLALDGLPVAGTRIQLLKAWSQLRTGLLNHASLPDSDGLLLRGTGSVHTKGMLFPIDLVFMDQNGTVLEIRENVPPGKGRIRGPNPTRQILELNGGTARPLYGITENTRVGVTRP